MLVPKTISTFLSFGLLLLVASCADPAINQEAPAYPIEMQGNRLDLGVSLTWTQVTVSTFEEYLVIRSTEPIEDSTEPDLGQFGVVAARIDAYDENSHIDFDFPVEEKLYYKVYAKIGDRFLFSPTIKIDLDFQLLDFRVDQFHVDIESHELIGFDRTRDQLFTYNYQTDEVGQTSVQNWSNPIIRTGQFAGQEEIYVLNGSQLLILNRSDHTVKSSFFMTSSIIDYQYANGFFAVAANSGITRNYIYRRSTQSLISNRVAPSSSSKKIFLKDQGDGTLLLYDFTLTERAIFRVDINGFLSTVSSEVEFSLGSFMIGASNSDMTDFVITNAGQMVDASLANTRVLDGGIQFYQGFTFADDDSALFALTPDTRNVRVYDATDNYKFDQEIRLNFNASALFADEGRLHAFGLLFTGGSVRTVFLDVAY